MESVLDRPERRDLATTLKQMVDDAAERVEELNPVQCQRWIEEVDDPLVIDIREPNEYWEGAVPGAIHIPRGLLDLLAEPDYPEHDPRLSNRDRPILLYCRSGLRSVLAADILHRMGFTQVVSMAGGLVDWRQVEGPLEQPESSPFA